MGLLQAFKNALNAAGEQLTQPNSPPVKDIHFSNNFQQKAKACGLSERDALDVFYHGSSIEEYKKVKKYNGYEIGIWYFTDYLTGQPVIHSVWKRGDGRNPIPTSFPIFTPGTEPSDHKSLPF